MIDKNPMVVYPTRVLILFFLRADNYPMVELGEAKETLTD